MEDFDKHANLKYKNLRRQLSCDGQYVDNVAYTYGHHMRKEESVALSQYIQVPLKVRKQMKVSRRTF